MNVYAPYTEIIHNTEVEEHSLDFHYYLSKCGANMNILKAYSYV